jgi:hypothetical protein
MRRIRTVTTLHRGRRLRANHGILYDDAIYCPSLEDRIEIPSGIDQVDCGGGVIKTGA